MSNFGISVSKTKSKAYFILYLVNISLMPKVAAMILWLSLFLIACFRFQMKGLKNLCRFCLSKPVLLMSIWLF